MRLSVIYKMLILALIATMAVGCEAGFIGDSSSADPKQPNKILIPINRRPRYPGGIIKEPRIIDDNFTFEIYRPSKPASYSVTVRSVATGEEYRAELRKQSCSVTIPCLVVNDEYEITVISEDGTIVESVTLATVDAK